MKEIVKQSVLRYFDNKKELSTQELINLLTEEFPHWTLSTKRTYLTRLKTEGIIYSCGRGLYTRDLLKVYIPFLSTAAKSLSDKIRKEYPYITFCIWDSGWLNEFMHHQMIRSFLVIEVEKEGITSVFNYLSNTSKKVFLDPDNIVFERYVSNYDNPIIIEPLLSESPLTAAKKTQLPTLEKLLVDIVADTTLFSSQQGELDFMYREAFRKYMINTKKMERYASRRNQREKVHSLIGQTLANIENK